MLSQPPFALEYPAACSWDRHYERELELYDSSGDEGEIWFGRCAERCMVEFVDRNVSKDSRIVEIGCGNGSLLRKLASA